jgi:hypothetical protein
MQDIMKFNVVFFPSNVIGYILAGHLTVHLMGDGGGPPLRFDFYDLFPQTGARSGTTLIVPFSACIQFSLVLGTALGLSLQFSLFSLLWEEENSLKDI